MVTRGGQCNKAMSQVYREANILLKVLSESSGPLGTITSAQKLECEGVFLSERTVRCHFGIASERGYTKPEGREGRIITPGGKQKVKEALASQHGVS